MNNKKLEPLTCYKIFINRDTFELKYIKSTEDFIDSDRWGGVGMFFTNNEGTLIELNPGKAHSWE